jgi:hypothetical protein
MAAFFAGSFFGVENAITAATAPPASSSKTTIAIIILRILWLFFGAFKGVAIGGSNCG